MACLRYATSIVIVCMIGSASNSSADILEVSHARARKLHAFMDGCDALRVQHPYDKHGATVDIFNISQLHSYAARFGTHELVSVKVQGGPCMGIPAGDIHFYFRAHSSDYKVFAQTWPGSERFDFHFLLDVFPPGMQPRVVVDLGSNVGILSKLFATLWPDAKVIAVEANLGNFLATQVNTFKHGNVVAEHAALWPTATFVRMNKPWTGNEWGAVVEPLHELERTRMGEVVRGLTMDMLMRRHNIDIIDLLKMDIEGGEASVLDPSAHPETWLTKVRCLSIEIHAGPSWPLVNMSLDWPDKVLLPLMAKLKFKRITPTFRPFIEIEVWCKDDSQQQA